VTNLQTSLVVEAYLDRARIIGVLPGITQNRRLVDLLCTQDAAIVLDLAEARLTGGSQGYRFKSVTVRKADLLYAIPRETSEQLRARALMRTGMPTQTSLPMALAVLLPTCHIAGTTLIPTAMSRPNVEASQFPHFFAITGAVITQADGTSREEQVVIVNRDAIVALGRPNES
jgi:hypothetical protein